MRYSLLISILLPLAVFAAPLPPDIGKPLSPRGFDVVPGEALSKATADTKAPGVNRLLKDGTLEPLLQGPSLKLLEGSPGAFPEELVKYTYKVDPTLVEQMRATWTHGSVYFQQLMDDVRRVNKHWDSSDEPLPMHTPSEFIDLMAAKNEEVWKAKGENVAKKIQEFKEGEHAKIWKFLQDQALELQKNPKKESKLNAQAVKFYAQRQRKQIRFSKKVNGKLKKINQAHSTVKDMIQQERTKDKYQGPEERKYITKDGTVIKQKDLDASTSSAGTKSDGQAKSTVDGKEKGAK